MRDFALFSFSGRYVVCRGNSILTGLTKTVRPTKPPLYSHPIPTCAPTVSGILGSSETMTEVHSDADRNFSRRH